MFPDETRETMESFATVLQWFFGNHDYICFTLARRGDYETFHSHCCFGLYPKLQQSDVRLLPSWKKEISNAWAMFHALPRQLLQRIYTKLPAEDNAQVVYRGMMFTSAFDVDEFLEQLLGEGFHTPESFSLSV